MGKHKMPIINSLMATKKAFESRLQKKITAPIESCRHYCGFRYGSKSFNPYENYIKGLHENEDEEILKRRFELFLARYRPTNFGEVLGVHLLKDYPLWCFPWGRNCRPGNGWVDSPEDVCDVMTHFCAKGIPKGLVQKEHFWHKRAYESIATSGYKPQEFGYIQLLEIKVNADCVYIVTDGNHRISALAALGHKTVDAKIHLWRNVRVQHIEKFEQVVCGNMFQEDALRIIEAYRDGVERPFMSELPADIV